MTPGRTLTVAVLAAAMAACNAGSNVLTTYEQPSPEGAPYSAILVVGAHSDLTARRQFEDMLVEALSAEGTRAVPSSRVMGTDALDANAVKAAAEAARADAVLITRLVDVRGRSEVEDGRASAAAERRNEATMVDFFRYDYVEYQDPLALTTVHTVICATDLYAVSDSSKVWSIESTAFEKETVADAMADISSGIRAQLLRDRLIH